MFKPYTCHPLLLSDKWKSEHNIVIEYFFSIDNGNLILSRDRVSTSVERA